MVAERSVKQTLPILLHFTVKVSRMSLSMKPGREASGGEIGSENVDMSSDKQSERLCRRKSKGSCLKLI